MLQSTWGVVPIALPYAADNTTNSYSNDGEDFLQWAITIGYFCEFIGSITSYLATRKFWIPEFMVLNTMGSAVIVMAACNVAESWNSWEMKILLIMAVATNRFSFGWIMPLIPRELSRRFPDKKELLVRSNSLWSVYATIAIRFPLWYFTK